MSLWEAQVDFCLLPELVNEWKRQPGRGSSPAMLSVGAPIHQQPGQSCLGAPLPSLVYHSGQSPGHPRVGVSKNTKATTYLRDWGLCPATFSPHTASETNRMRWWKRSFLKFFAFSNVLSSKLAPPYSLPHTSVTFIQTGSTKLFKCAFL